MRDAAPGYSWIREIPPLWTNAVATALMRVNPFTRSLTHLSTLLPQAPNANIVLGDNAVGEIPAIIRLDNSAAAELAPRSLVVSPQGPRGGNVRIPAISRLWEPLAYPLFFPHGEPGWGVPGTEQLQHQGLQVPNEDVPTTQIWHYRRRILSDDRFRIFGRLTNEYLVDMFSRNLEMRLHYITANQERLRREDAMLMGGEGLGDEAYNVYLPASFIGSRCWAAEQVRRRNNPLM